MMGWAAARGSASTEAWVLFWVLFLWQMPHFLAIAWIYREDYEKGGFPMLSVLDPTGGSCGRQSLLYGSALVPVSLLPTSFGWVDPTYLWGALLLGLGFVGFILRFSASRTRGNARHLFLASLLYLPALLSLLCLFRRP
jgi:protoheme IX farnesyltransferase